MTPLGVWLTITIVVTVGLFLGVVLSWVDPPSWATPRLLAVILLLVAAADVGITYLQQTVPVVAGTGGQDASAANAGQVPVSTIDGAQVSRAILSSSGENNGNARLIETSLNGRVKQALGPSPFGGPFAVLSQRELVVSAIPDRKAHADGLGITTLSGSLVRRLTRPPAGADDHDPAVTRAGNVYFLRTMYQWYGQNGTPAGTYLMEASVSGHRPAVRLPVARPPVDGSLSVNPAGTLLAGVCVSASGNVDQACVYDLPSGRLRYATRFDGSSPVADDAISPDGKYLAYSDGATNPYGGMQVYVRNMVTGSTVRVSSQPGSNLQPRWILGSAAPCLLFSNTQTSGYLVYLSCLTAHPGTARVTSGEYPVWLGAPMPAATPPAPTIDWRAWWKKAEPAVVLVLSFMVGLLLGLFSGWVERPKWATRGRVAGLVAVLGAVQVGGGVIIPQVFVQPSGGLTTVARLDPAQAGGLLLAQDSINGSGQVIGVRLDGTNQEPLQFFPGGNAFIPVGNSASRFILNDGGSTSADIRLVGPTGNVIRELAMGPPGKTDESLALAESAQQVFFEQATLVANGPGTYAVSDPQIMRIPLAGGPVRHVALDPRPANGPISVNAAGTELAAPCVFKGDIYACVYSLPGGTLRYSVPTPVEALALSPDGQYLAYGSGICQPG